MPHFPLFSSLRVQVIERAEVFARPNFVYRLNSPPGGTPGLSFALAAAHAAFLSKQGTAARDSTNEGTMDLMRHRPYLRALTPQQRRSWWEQRKRLKARVVIGTAWLPPQVRRSYAYAQRI